MFVLAYLPLAVMASVAKTSTASGYGGAVAIISAQALHAALDILRAGGNAIDAAVLGADMPLKRLWSWFCSRNMSHIFIVFDILFAQFITMKIRDIVKTLS